MKLVAKILMLVVILSLCFSTVGCTWYCPEGNFKVKISKMWSYNTVDFQIAESYYIRVYTLDNSFINVDDVLLEYNENDAVLTSKYDSRDEACFNLYFYELSNDSELKVTYNGHTVTIPYNVVDYDFESHDYETISSIDDLDKYPEIKEMILSIKYHEFQDPYIGLDDEWDSEEYEGLAGEKYVVHRRSCSLDENDYNYISTDYVKYFTDSVYYPEKFNSVPKNRVASTELYMYMPSETEVANGMPKSAMTSFFISYGVCDPCCTAKYPLTSMSYSGQYIDYFGYFTVDGKSYPNTLAILLERYPDKFFQYQLGDLTIYILCEKEEGASAYFFAGDYFYSLSGYYNQEYK